MRITINAGSDEEILFAMSCVQGFIKDKPSTQRLGIYWHPPMDCTVERKKNGNLSVKCQRIKEAA